MLLYEQALLLLDVRLNNNLLTTKQFGPMDFLRVEVFYPRDLCSSRILSKVDW